MPGSRVGPGRESLGHPGSEEDDGAEDRRRDSEEADAKNLNAFAESGREEAHEQEGVQQETDGEDDVPDQPDAAESFPNGHARQCTTLQKFG